MNLIRQRKIEAEMAAALIRGCEPELGREKAFEIASDTVRKLACESGKNIAGKYGSNTLEDLVRVIREIWSQGNALDIEFLEESNEKLFFNVRRCGYAEMYRDAGLSEFGYCLSCNRDAAFVSGFNSRIAMKRTQTIMEGASYCDFRFYLS